MGLSALSGYYPAAIEAAGTVVMVHASELLAAPEVMVKKPAPPRGAAT